MFIVKSKNPIGFFLDQNGFFFLKVGSDFPKVFAFF